MTTTKAILQLNIRRDAAEVRRDAMQKGNLYGAIFIVNRGIDDAVTALERLKQERDARDAGVPKWLFCQPS